MIAWKVVGDDLWSIIGGTLAWFVITLIILWSYRHFHMNERVVKKVEGGDQVEYVSRYDFEDDGKKAYLSGHTLSSSSYLRLSASSLYSKQTSIGHLSILTSPNT